MKAITGKPIKFASTGEKVDALEVFHPDRMASRILGMGDVLTLIERAEAAVEEDEQAEMEKRLAAGPVHVRRLPEGVQDAAPDGAAAGDPEDDPGHAASSSATSTSTSGQLGRVEAIVLSMTPQERRSPIVIDGKRRLRIAQRLRDDGRAGEPAARGPEADGEDDEADGAGEDAGASRPSRRPRRFPQAGRRGVKRKKKRAKR